MKHFLRVITVMLVLTPVTAVTVFLSMGGRISTIETPSMAEYAPVGTVVVTEPVKTADLHVGNAILFTPPGDTRTFFHRVVKITSQGIATRGDLNPDADPWLLHASNIHGREVFRIASLGWFIKYIPILGLGFAGIAVLLRFFTRPGRRLSTFVFTGSILVTIANLVVRPFSRAAMLSQTVNASGDTVVNFVVTGVLPLTAKTADSTITAVPGQFATLVFKNHETHRLTLTPALDNPYLVAGLILVDLLPLIIAIIGRIVASRTIPTVVEPTPEIVNDINLDTLATELNANDLLGAKVNIFDNELMLDIDRVYRNRVRDIDAMYAQRAATYA